jgi:hypothetical protein
MIESLNIRKVKNGYVIEVQMEDDNFEYICQTERQMLKFIKEQFKDQE